MAKIDWKKAFVIGLKLFAIGIITMIPFWIIRMVLVSLLGITQAGWLATGNLLATIPLLLGEITLFGYLVYRWRKWVF